MWSRIRQSFTFPFKNVFPKATISESKLIYVKIPPGYMAEYAEFVKQHPGKNTSFGLKVIGQDSDGSHILGPDFKIQPDSVPLDRTVPDPSTREAFVKAASDTSVIKQGAEDGASIGKIGFALIKTALEEAGKNC